MQAKMTFLSKLRFMMSFYTASRGFSFKLNRWDYAMDYLPVWHKMSIFALQQVREDYEISKQYS